MSYEPRLGVVGFGLMGAGIVEVSARAGLDVVVVEANQTAAAAGSARLAKSLRRAEERGKLDSAEAVLAAVAGRVRLGVVGRS